MSRVEVDTGGREERAAVLSLLRVWGASLLATVVGLVVLGVVFYRPIAAAVEVWIGSRTFNHCFLVVPLALYLAWERRSRLIGLAPSPSFWGAVLALASGGLWYVAAATGTREGEQLALLAMVQSLFLALFGTRIYRRMAAPLLFLFFLVPSGEFLVPWLQSFTAKFTVLLLRLAQVPVFSDGVIIETPAGTFEVAEACAGLRFLIASVAFGAFYSLTIYRRPWKRAVFFSFSIVVPVVANGLRAFGIVGLAQITGDAAAAAADHIIYGWLFFSIVLLVLIAVGLSFRDDLGGEAVPASSRRPIAAPAGAATLGLVFAAYLAAIGAPIALLEVNHGRPARVDLSAAINGPAASGGWGVDVQADDWKPVFPMADGEVLKAYGNGSRRAWFYAALFAKPGGEAKLVSSLNRMADPETWIRTASGAAATGSVRPPARVNVERIVSDRRSRLVWWWYWVDGTFTTSPLEVKIRQAKAAILGESGGAAVVAIAVEGVDADESAAARDFLDHLEPVASFLGRVLNAR